MADFNEMKGDNMSWDNEKESKRIIKQWAEATTVVSARTRLQAALSEAYHAGWKDSREELTPTLQLAYRRLISLDAEHDGEKDEACEKIRIELNKK